MEAGGEAAIDDHARTAHEVARQVSSMVRFGVWHRDTPTCVQELLEQDCNHLP